LIVADIRIRVAYVGDFKMIDYKRRNLRLVHTSDVHLGAFSSSPRGREDERNKKMENAFSAVINLAIKESADILLIVGDFFDNGRVKDDVLDFAAREINRFPGETVLLPGNHDPIGKFGPYARFNSNLIASRLHLLNNSAGTTLFLDGYDLQVWGRAVDDDCTIRPLQDVPSLDKKSWSVAVAHGHFALDGQDTERSLRISPEDLRLIDRKFDYIALGHWEVQQVVSAHGVEAVYSGAPSPFSSDSVGSAVIIDLKEGQKTVWNPMALDKYL